MLVFYATLYTQEDMNFTPVTVVGCSGMDVVKQLKDSEAFGDDDDKEPNALEAYKESNTLEEFKVWIAKHYTYFQIVDGQSVVK